MLQLFLGTKHIASFSNSLEGSIQAHATLRHMLSKGFLVFLKEETTICTH